MDRVQLLRTRQRLAAPMTGDMQTRRTARTALRTRLGDGLSGLVVMQLSAWFMAAKKCLCEQAKQFFVPPSRRERPCNAKRMPYRVRNLVLDQVVQCFRKRMHKSHPHLDGLAMHASPKEQCKNLYWICKLW
jgi:hypothetical protein